LGPEGGRAAMTGSRERPRRRREPVPIRLSLRQRLDRRPLGLELTIGLVLLGAYVVVALSAIVVFWGTLGTLATQTTWIPPPPFFRATLGPSAQHPLGVLPGIGTDIFQAIWQATPWDLAIVGGILLFDVVLGWMLGGLAGMNEGGWADALVRFFGDTIGSIPSFFWVIAILAGIVALHPSALSIPVFVVVFGVVIWPTTARTTREAAREVARSPFLESARASGASRTYLYFRHILPNSTLPLLAQAPLDVAPIFFVLATFPWFWDCAGPNINHNGGSAFFLVPSVPNYSPLPSVNFPEWGNLLAVGVCEGLPITTVGPIYWWMFVPTLVAILGLGIAIALVCDGLVHRTRRFRAWRRAGPAGVPGPQRRAPKDSLKQPTGLEPPARG
jgi:ABC-type dipeptide/oligopeptide/nickel transport system permease subunit